MSEATDNLRLAIGNLFNNTYRRGDTTFLYGRAIAPPESQIYIELLDADQKIISEQDIDVGESGYWEAAIDIPASFSDTGSIKVSIPKTNLERNNSIFS